VRTPHEECGYRLTCGERRVLQYEGGEWGSIVPLCLQTTVAALIEFLGIF
jgi:hypothetical protein